MAIFAPAESLPSPATLHHTWSAGAHSNPWLWSRVSASLHNEIAQARRRCERSLGLRVDASEVGVLHCEAGREHGVVIFVIIRFYGIIIIERSIIN